MRLLLSLLSLLCLLPLLYAFGPIARFGKFAVGNENGFQLMAEAQRQQQRGQVLLSMKGISQTIEFRDDSNEGTASNSNENGFLWNRRRLMHQMAALAAGTNLLSSTDTNNLLFGKDAIAHARGLVQFPCDKPLHNTYHLIRAGNTLLEQEDIWSTNPLFLTNREGALSDLGTQQVQAACQLMRAKGELPSVIKYSLAASATDTANVIASEMIVGRDRIIPEFTFMDPRAIGKWDMSSLESTTPAVWAMDANEAGKDGTGARPPPNDDGTAHETLADQSVRIRQLLSILETQYSGDTIVLVFPDGTSPALVSCLMAGIPLNNVHELEFASGEIRLNVTKDTTLQLFNSRRQDIDFQQNYQQTIQAGEMELNRLRSITGEMISKKDAKIEAERIAMDAAYEKRQVIKRAKQQQEELARTKRLRELADKNSRNVDSSLMSMGIVSAGILGIAAAGIIGTTTNYIGSTIKDSKSTTSESLHHGNNNESLLSDMNNASLDAMGERLQQRQSHRPGSLYDDDDDDDVNIIIRKTSTYEDRFENAQKAMQEYMDKDDGGDAWIQSVMEMAQTGVEMDDENQLLDTNRNDTTVDSTSVFESDKQELLDEIQISLHEEKEATLLQKDQEEEDFSSGSSSTTSWTSSSSSSSSSSWPPSYPSDTV